MNTPQLPPLVVQSNGKYSYLCSFTNKWDKDKKRSYRSHRAYLWVKTESYAR